MHILFNTQVRGINEQDNKKVFHVLMILVIGNTSPARHYQSAVLFEMMCQHLVYQTGYGHFATSYRPYQGRDAAMQAGIDMQ